MQAVLLLAVVVCALFSVQALEVESGSKDAEGCSNAMCFMYCYYGNYKDDNGCTMCKCYEKPRDDCSPITCYMHCERGFQYEEGCPVCKCR